MGRFEKLLKRFLSKPKDFSYDELTRLLASLGYEKVSTGKTAGSRVAFVNPETRHIIKLHRPHPRPELKRYQLDDIEETLRNKGVIQ
ncbi:MAG: type II toxin-antitoxin system HicA family toxin [Planctomycetia bacterium]|nr:type II toxin-antitoxin system HicA family toxin [Planctomycetia bacterium]